MACGCCGPEETNTRQAQLPACRRVSRGLRVGRPGSPPPSAASARFGWCPARWAGHRGRAAQPTSCPPPAGSTGCAPPHSQPAHGTCKRVGQGASRRWAGQPLLQGCRSKVQSVEQPAHPQTPEPTRTQGPHLYRMPLRRPSTVHCRSAARATWRKPLPSSISTWQAAESRRVDGTWPGQGHTRNVSLSCAAGHRPRQRCPTPSTTCACAGQQHRCRHAPHTPSRCRRCWRARASPA